VYLRQQPGAASLSADRSSPPASANQGTRSDMNAGAASCLETSLTFLPASASFKLVQTRYFGCDMHLYDGLLFKLPNHTMLLIISD